jgi:hypothetical protein
MASPADRALELVAQRQARRRGFNERLEVLDSSEDATLFRCECGLIACGAVIKLTASEYAGVRADPRQFAVLAGHALPDAERVVASRRGWAIVEKFPGSASDIATRDYEARAGRPLRSPAARVIGAS